MADNQAYRGLEGHPTELSRIRDVASRLSGSVDAGGSNADTTGDDYKEEIGYSAEELAEAKAGRSFNPMTAPTEHQPGMPPEGAKTTMIEAGVTSDNSPNANINYPTKSGRKGY